MRMIFPALSLFLVGCAAIENVHPDDLMEARFESVSIRGPIERLSGLRVVRVTFPRSLRLTSTSNHESTIFAVDARGADLFPVESIPPDVLERVGQNQLEFTLKYSIINTDIPLLFVKEFKVVTPEASPPSRTQAQR